MRRVLTLLLTAALSLGMTSAAFAQSDEELSSTSVFPPDSPLFALQHVLDGWEELLALDDVTKAEVLAKIADNRLAEAAEMLAEGNEDVAADMIEQMQDALAKAADKLSKALEKIAAKNDDEDSEEASGKEAAHEQVLERLEANLERHRTHLESVLDKLENENAREALERVLERRHGLENAMDKIRQQAEDDEDASAEEDEDSEDEEADEDDDDGPGNRPAGKGKPSKP